MKILTYPKNIEEIEKTKDLVDGFIIGIKDMSVNANMYIKKLNINFLSRISLHLLYADFGFLESAKIYLFPL